MKKHELFVIDRNLHVPLYIQIMQNVRNLIIQKKLKAGEALPSEWELAEYFGVSRPTVRKALDDLVREGWLHRRHGVGTFVANPTMAQIAPGQLSFTQQVLAIGRKPSSRVVSVHVIEASAEIANTLWIPTDGHVLEIVRVRLVDDEALMLETAYLHAERFPGLEDLYSWINHSLYQTLAERYGTHVAIMDQTIEPVLLDKRQAKMLDAQFGMPALYSKVISYTQNSEPIEYSWSVTRGDRCKFIFSFRKGGLTP